jgi:GH24 family phage-related lysozyme (muramidase)
MSETVSYNFGAHFFERSTMAMPLTAEEIEFKAEDTLITIVPKFRHDPFHFITVI